MALVTDFSGTYDYEREEARQEAEAFIMYADEYTDEENATRVAKLRAHWGHVLTPEGLADFIDEFNARSTKFKMIA